MFATAEAFLPVVLVRENLRLPVAETDGDMMLTQHVKSAVGAIERIAERRVLSGTEERRLSYLNVYHRGWRDYGDESGSAARYVPRYWYATSRRQEYVHIEGPDITASTVHTWSVDAPEETGVWTEPDDDVTPSRVLYDNLGAKFWPPVGGWPTKEMLFRLTVGMEDGSGDLEAARQAGLVYVRTAFDGSTFEADGEAFRRLVLPIKYMGGSRSARQGVI